MKKQEFIDIKGLDQKALWAKVTQLKGEVADLVLDKNMNKLKDLKAIFKKRKDIAKILTVIKQKELLEKLEAVEEVKEVKKDKKQKKEESLDSGR